ncbi:hypothetical protein D8T25_08345 [Vibrio vulnificus]|nr:hypothetical protein D8T25_08345 [Vibrio vulnificus]
MLLDYREQFYSSQRASTIGMDKDTISSKFAELDVELEMKLFSDVNFNVRYDGTYVLYQSSEDRGLLYKSYISDVLLTLQELGAILVPSYSMFHAHHNKSYQEIMRKGIELDGMYNLNSRSFGCYEELKKYSFDDFSFPLVMKSSEGCKSKSVLLVKSRHELFTKAKKISRSLNVMDCLRFLVKRIIRDGYIPESNSRNKFVIQEFIHNLGGDYKVLVYGDKLFVLARANRKGDFRASGSGIFEFPKEPPVEVLNIAKGLLRHFKVPYASFDIAFDSKTGMCYLIEFQFLMFGTYTLEKSNWYFKLCGESWVRIEEQSILEEVFVESVYQYIGNLNFS